MIADIIPGILTSWQTINC